MGLASKQRDSIMSKAPFNHRLYNRLNGRLNIGWEIIEYVETNIDDEPYTLLICRKNSDENKQRIFTEKGHVFTQDKELTELGRVMVSIYRKMKRTKRFNYYFKEREANVQKE